GCVVQADGGSRSQDVEAMPSTLNPLPQITAVPEQATGFIKHQPDQHRAIDEISIILHETEQLRQQGQHACAQHGAANGANSAEYDHDQHVNRGQEAEIVWRDVVDEVGV